MSSDRIKYGLVRDGVLVHMSYLSKEKEQTKLLPDLPVLGNPEGTNMELIHLRFEKFSERRPD